MNTNFEDLLDVKASKVNETSSLTFLASPSPQKVLSGIGKVGADVVEDMAASGEPSRICINFLKK